jgi:RimJ/RimL family protein N-acetyltransferase
MGALVDHWPIAGLRLTTSRLELRWPSDDDLVALAEVAAAGIHDVDDMPFGIPWSRAPEGELERGVIQYHWRTRGAWAPDDWSWNPVVVFEGQVVGTQGMTGRDFVLRRTVNTGSWLGRDYQGRGIGTEMRAAVLHLAFAGLRARRAETDVWDDNAASLGVTRRLGYQPNGERIEVSEDRGRRQVFFRLSRDDWEQQTRPEVEVDGLAPCLAQFGATERPPRTESNPPRSDR